MLLSDTQKGFQRPSETFEFRWSNSLSFALRIAALYRHGDWSNERFLEGDPVTLFPILWTAAAFLCLGLMRTGPVDATEKLALLDALDAVMAQLRLTSRCWGVTGMLLCESFSPRCLRVPSPTKSSFSKPRYRSCEA